MNQKTNPTTRLSLGVDQPQFPYKGLRPRPGKWVRLKNKLAKAYQDTAAADEARRYMTAQYVRMERMFDKEKAAKNESYDFITRSGMLEDFNAFRNNPDSLELRKGTTDTPDLRRQLGEAHAEIICLSRKIAELRQQHTEISDRLKASEMRYEAYQEQNAALYLMTDTQNNRITKLMDMLERLTTKQRGQ